MDDYQKAVLCVDDEANILSSLKRLLRKEGYKLFTAGSGKEGLDILEKEFVQVVLSDQRMPEMTGVSFLQEVKKLYPDTIRVVLSGYADLGTIVDAINQGEIFRFLTKPWNDENLKADIRQCFEHYEMVKENNKMINVIKEQNEQLTVLNEQLEQQVLERTKSLSLSQDILEKMPQPVLCISAEFQVILANEAASEKYSELQFFFPGTSMDGLLPVPLCDAVRETVQTLSQVAKRIDWNEKQIVIKTQPLIAQDTVRGVVVVTS